MDVAARQPSDARAVVYAPEHGVYANESDLAQALLGHATGDLVTFTGND